MAGRKGYRKYRDARRNNRGKDNPNNGARTKLHRTAQGAINFPGRRQH